MNNQLDEIKHLYNYLEIAYRNKDGNKDGNHILQTLVELFSEGHIDWLIKRAELADRYENPDDILSIKNLLSQIEKLEQDIYWYRERIKIDETS